MWLFPINYIGYGACENGDILLNHNSNLNSIIICSGEDSCNETKITNSKIIVCNGLNSCSLSTITNVKILYMLGSESGVNSIVTSPMNDDNVKFYFYGYQSGLNASIYCNRNSTCHIYSTITATNKNFNTNLICQGTCIIDCYTPVGTSAIKCFNVILQNDTFSHVTYVTETPTTAPTFAPTKAPTREPTEIAYAIVAKLECVVKIDDNTDDDGCSIDTDDELSKCCKFENTYVVFVFVVLFNTSQLCMIP